MAPPPEEAVWSEDKCTCRHGVSKHKDGDGRCSECDHDISWGDRKNPCLRFQWNGEPRVRTW